MQLMAARLRRATMSLKTLPATKAVPLMTTAAATSKVLLGHLSSVVLPRIQLDELNHLAFLRHHLFAFRKRNP
jgi:hypothetical protein